MTLSSALRQALLDAANPDNAPAMQAYMKSEMPYYGVKSGAQQKIYKLLLKQNPLNDFKAYQQIIEDLWLRATHREERYAAIAVARHYPKFQTLAALPTYRMMIESGAWWDYVDTIAAHLIGNLLENFPTEMRKILDQWIKDEHLWIRRSAILSQLRFKQQTDQEMLFRSCELCLAENTFWMRKAIGWALREYSKTNPAAVREFVEQYRDRMSGLTRREASKYI